MLSGKGFHCSPRVGVADVNKITEPTGSGERYFSDLVIAPCKIIFAENL